MMFVDFNVWLLMLDDDSYAVYIEQYGKVYVLQFANARALKDFCRTCLDFAERTEPKLSQKIIDEINKIE